MSFAHWDKLLYGIERGECILFLGPELPVDTAEGPRQVPAQTLARRLLQPLDDEGLADLDPRPSDLAWIAQRFVAQEDELSLELGAGAMAPGMAGGDRRPCTTTRRRCRFGSSSRPGSTRSWKPRYAARTRHRRSSGIITAGGTRSCSPSRRLRRPCCSTCTDASTRRRRSSSPRCSSSTSWRTSSHATPVYPTT